MKDINRQNLYYLAKHIFEKERIILWNENIYLKLVLMFLHHLRLLFQ